MKTQDKLNMKENEVKRFKGINGMNSLEIAELTGKKHKNVMRDIRTMVENINQSISGLVENCKNDYHRGDRTQYKFLSENTQKVLMDFWVGEQATSPYKIEIADYTDAKGEKRKMYVLNKRAVYLLASGYNVLLRAKIIDRLEELELQKRNGIFKVPQTFAQALRLIAEQQETIERQQRTIEVQKPKAIYFDSLVDRGLNVCFRDAAKEIGVKQKEFIAYLIENKYVYRNKAGKLRPHADYDNDLFVVKDTKSNNNGLAGVQTLVTPKGKETFRLLLNA